MHPAWLFAFWFAFSVVPNVAPFLAFTTLPFLEHKAIRRGDLFWIVGSGLLAGPLVASGDIVPAVMALFQIAAAWLIWRSFFFVRGRIKLESLHPVHYQGLLLGLACSIAISLSQIDVAFSLRLSQALIWSGSPALFGHTVLTLGVLIATMVPSGAMRALALVLSAVGVLLSGAREAALAWLLVTLVLQVLAPLRTIKGRLVERLVLVAMLALAAGVGSSYGFGRLGFLVDLAPGAGGANLLHGTELPRGDWWFERGIAVETGKVELDGRELVAYRAVKTEPEGWRRLQQVITLEPGTTYTASTWIGPSSSSEAVPGLQGWGEGEGLEPFIVVAALREGSLHANATGPGAVLSSGVEGAEGGWRRAWVTFTYEGERPLTWWLGLTPDQRETVGPWTEFAGFQLEAAAQPGPYVPASVTQGLGLAAGRAPFWSAAWRGFLERPLLGWGAVGFDVWYLEHGGGLGRFYEVPTHTHSLPLQILFERGLVGFAGLLLLLAALARAAVRARDVAMLAALAAVLFANGFDYTLFYGGVLYPLAAVAGWRAAEARSRDRAGAEAARLATTRLALGGADALAALAALAGAFALRAWVGGEAAGTGVLAELRALPPVAFYALLLWPAAAWREGLYPGYGMTAPGELRRQVHAGLFAGLLLTAGTLLFPEALPLPRGVLIGTVLLAVLLAPIGRALTKRALLTLGAWGRPVVILGAGEAGRRVARALQRTPLDGLQPIAFFDDDPAKRRTRVEGLRVMGGLEDADAFALRFGADHALVAIPSLPEERLAWLVERRGRAFRSVQFVPRLPGLPTESVVASDLDGMLALEVRHGLHSGVNRFVKRAIDLGGAVAGGILAAPFLLAIWLWVRLDSKGPGFYWSERVGEDGRPFRCLKFRTMHVDAEERLQRLLQEDEAVRSEYGRWHKLERDPRVTRAGAVLRRYSLDELAQLWNVLRGEMSLVGPRPYLVRELPDIGPRGETIFRAKPGMTGYWQVSGRSDVTFEERVAMETRYVRDWSVYWDVVLLLRTAEAVLGRRGAR